MVDNLLPGGSPAWYARLRAVASPYETRVFTWANENTIQLLQTQNLHGAARHVSLIAYLRRILVEGMLYLVYCRGGEIVQGREYENSIFGHFMFNSQEFRVDTESSSMLRTRHVERVRVFI